MKAINFMPESLDGKRIRRRRVVGFSVALVAVISSTIAWSKIESDRRMEAIGAELTRLLEEGERRQRQEQARQAAAARVQLQRRLESPVPVLSVIALVADHMPPSVGLLSLSLVGEPIDPAPGGRRSVKKRGTSERYSEQPPLLLVLQGIAPDDVTVARFIEQLDSQPLFEKLELGFCRPADGGSFHARTFEITARIPLDRTVVLDPPREVVRVD